MPPPGSESSTTCWSARERSHPSTTRPPHPNGERWLKPPSTMAPCFEIRPGGAAGDARDRRALRVFARGSRLHVPAASRCRREGASRACSKPCAGAGSHGDTTRAIRCCPRCAGNWIASSASSAAWASTAIPGRMDIVEFARQQEHHDPGPRLRGQLGLMLQSLASLQRSGANGSAVRTLSVRRRVATGQQRADRMPDIDLDLPSGDARER